jgi:carbonic anhydrase
MKLIKVTGKEHIPAEYMGTPVEMLIGYQNLDYKYKDYVNAEILVGMCMDNRKMLHLPENFAFIIRTAGANLRYSDFKVAFAIAVGGVSAVAIIGHNDCGMANLMQKKDLFVKGIRERAGWDSKKAEEHFMSFAPFFEIENEEEFILSEAKRLREKFPKITVAPMIYRLEDNLLYFIKEN